MIKILTYAKKSLKIRDLNQVLMLQFVNILFQIIMMF
jgi:hypothetical protein